MADRALYAGRLRNRIPDLFKAETLEIAMIDGRKMAHAMMPQRERKPDVVDATSRFGAAGR